MKQTFIITNIYQKSIEFCKGFLNQFFTKRPKVWIQDVCAIDSLILINTVHIYNLSSAYHVKFNLFPNKPSFYRSFENLS